MQYASVDKHKAPPLIAHRSYFGRNKTPYRFGRRRLDDHARKRRAPERLHVLLELDAADCAKQHRVAVFGGDRGGRGEQRLVRGLDCRGGRLGVALGRLRNGEKDDRKSARRVSLV